MTNKDERAAWFQTYVAEGVAAARAEQRRLFGSRGLRLAPDRLISVARWAHSMSLIAEQFTDHYVGDDLGGEGEDEEEDAE